MASKRRIHEPADTDIVPAQFQAWVDEALRNATDPLFLGQSPLALLPLLELPAGGHAPTSRHQRGEALEQFLRNTLETLRPSDRAPDAANPRDRLYLILRDSYFDRPDTALILAVHLAHKYKIAERTVHKASRDGRITLADRLWGRLTTALSTADFSPDEDGALALLSVLREGTEQAVLRQALMLLLGAAYVTVVRALRGRQLLSDGPQASIAVAPLVRLWYDTVRLDHESRSDLHRLAAEAHTVESDFLAAVYHDCRADQAPLAVRLLADAADSFIQQGQSQALADELAQLVPDVTNPDDQALLDITRGKVYSSLSQWDRALAHYQEALPLVKDDPLAVADLHRHMGRVYERRSDYSAAQAEYQAGLDILAQIGPATALEQAHFHIGIAVIHLLQQAYGETLARCQQAQEVLADRPGKSPPHPEVPPELDEGLIKLYKVEGHAYLLLGNNDAALEAYLKALQHAEASGDLAAQADVHEGLGNIYDTQGNYLAAIEHYQRALFLREPLPDRYARARLHQNLGVSYRNFGELDQAKKHYQQSLEIYHQVGNRRSIALGYSNIGEVHNDLGEYAQAQGYLQQSVAICRQEVGAVDVLPDALRNLARAHQGLDDLESALMYAQEALREARRADNRYIEGYCWETLGRVHQGRGEITEACEAYRQALAMFTKRGHADKIHALNALLTQLGCKEHGLTQTNR
jgi:tetratricopeptide (TPR) repeat protein